MPNKSKKTKHLDTACLICGTKYTHVGKFLGKKLKKDLKQCNIAQMIRDVWKKHCSDIGDYKVVLHKTKRRSHSLCFSCALNTLINHFEQVEEALHKRTKVEMYIDCYKAIQDKSEKKDATACKKKIHMFDYVMLLPRTTVNVLTKTEYDRLQKVFRDPPDCIWLHEMLYKHLIRLGMIFKGGHLRCVDFSCYGFMIADFSGYTCNSCLRHFCANCKSFHAGTCEEFRLRNAMDDETRQLLEEEMKTSEVKHCPGCHEIIQKNDGCNHITCLKCDTHFCWECLWVAPKHDNQFEENPIYQHMRVVHHSLF